MNIKLQRVLSVLTILLAIFFAGCKKDMANEVPVQPPPNNSTSVVLTTASITSITDTGAISGGNITSEGSAPVTYRGICYSTQPNPTVTGSRIVNGAGPGSFTCSIGNLIPGTTYYVRAFATTSLGTTYGNEVAFLTTTPPPDPAVTVYIGGSDTLYSLRATDGGLKWKIRIENIGSITYSSGKVFVISNYPTAPASNQIRCYDSLGVLQWLSGPVGLALGLPVCVNEVICLNTDGGLRAYNTQNGNFLWQYGMSQNWVQRICIANDAVVARSETTGKLVSLSIQTGLPVWESQSQAGVVAPTISNNKIYMAKAMSLQCFDALTGNLLWSNPDGVSEDYRTILTVSGNFLYFYNTDDHRIGSRAISDGAVRWIINLSAPYEINPRVCHIQNNVLVHGRFSTVYLRDPATGNINGSSTTGNGYSIAGDISCHEGKIYMAGRKNVDIPPYLLGYVKSVDVSTGATMWTSSERSDYTTTPCVVTASDKMHRAADVY